MNRGYTKRWRKRWDKGYHKDRLLWVMMSYFIDHANYCDSSVYFPNAGKIPLKRGQHIFGTVQMADFFRVDRGRIRRKLKILEKVGFLTIKTTNKYSVATIVNYNVYQSVETLNDHQTDQKAASKRPSNDHQTTTPKEVKKGKKGNNKEIYTSILSHLNQKTGKNFKPESKATQALIKARLNDGFKEPDFICVIDNQCKKWMTDPKMIEYLRPQTLFGTKFESYLNSCPSTQGTQKTKSQLEYERIMKL